MKRFFTVILIGLIFACAARSQDKAKPRVFVSDSQSWQVSGHFGGIRDLIFGTTKGGGRPQTAEIVKTMSEECKDSIVTIKKESADYILVLDHEGGKSAILKDNKFAVFNNDGDAVKSGSTRSLGGAVKNACKALMEDWVSKTKVRS